MRFFDALFGRTRLRRPKTEGLFDLVTAQVDLEVNLGWLPADTAALCLKPVTTVEFGVAQKELEELVRLAASDSGTAVRVEVDQFRYRWLIFTDPDFEDLVGVIHIAGNELLDKGYGEQLLAAVFRFRPEGTADPYYLIYGYKRGAFYPFIPLSGKRRDNPAELRAGALLERMLPTEKDQSRWYPLWDCPV
jgi:hypothetical protein